MQEGRSGIEYKHLSLEELQALGKRSSEGDLDARETLILSHLGLVNLVLQEYTGKGTDTEDLYQEGCYGLILAVDNYDYRRGTRLSTYAVYWIRKRMKRALCRQNKNYIFNMDPELYQQVCHYRQCHFNLQTMLDRTPSLDELVYATGLPAQKVRALQNLLASSISLDAPLPGCSEVALSSENPECTTHSQHYAPSAENLALLHLTMQDLNEVDVPIHSIPLTKREREILRRRLGFTPDGQPENWSTISDALGFSRPTIKQDYLEAIRKLREGLAGREDALST